MILYTYAFLGGVWGWGGGVISFVESAQNLTGEISGWMQGLSVSCNGHLSCDLSCDHTCDHT